jgi:hypothetical protein
MDIVPETLLTGLHASRARLAAASERVARAGTLASASDGNALMAAAAREALFSDALLGATRARLEELKSLTK